jgi:hypothetical protein
MFTVKLKMKWFFWNRRRDILWLKFIGAFIWEEIKKPKTIDEIKTAILAEYDVQNMNVNGSL